MIVQIFEVGTPEEAAAIARLGVDHVGVLVGKGAFPREIGYERARDIFKAVPNSSKTVALTLSPDIEEILEAVRAVSPHILHLGMPPEPIRPEHQERIRREFPRLEIMRTIPVRGGEAIPDARIFAPVSDYLLLDTQDPGQEQIGATGHTHDWSISRRIVDTVECRVVLAGGLGPENVAEAIRQVRPYGVDSKTRTDRTDGAGKDLDRAKSFCDAAKGALR